MALSGAILCRSNNIVTVIATGEYMDLERKMPSIVKVTKEDPIRLIDISNTSIDDILKDQTRIQSEFSSAFD